MLVLANSFLKPMIPHWAPKWGQAWESCCLTCALWLLGLSGYRILDSCSHVWPACGSCHYPLPDFPNSVYFPKPPHFFHWLMLELLSSANWVTPSTSQKTFFVPQMWSYSHFYPWANITLSLVPFRFTLPGSNEPGSSELGPSCKVFST